MSRAGHTKRSMEQKLKELGQYRWMSTAIKLAFLAFVVWTIFEVQKRSFIGIIFSGAILIGIVLGFFSRLTARTFSSTKRKN